MTGIRRQRGAKAHRHGLAMEARAAWFLRLKGYRILARRVKTPVGEIDLVAKRGNTLIFVEVKARADIASAAAALTPRTLLRMNRAAELFMMSYKASSPATLRMDMMLITPKRLWPLHIRGESSMR